MADVIATEDFDVLFGRSDPDGNVIAALGGDDLVEGSGNTDTIFGGAGNDEIYGNGGNDYIEGNIGRDELHGGGGDDILVSSETLGNGDNAFIFNPNAPFDILEGGDGADIFSVSNGGQALVTDFSLAEQDRIELSALDNFGEPVRDERNGTLSFSGDTTTMIVQADPADFDAIINSVSYF